MTEGAGVHEIVIIRRPKFDGEESHHGGVWKIAFADFMTAMMAFFLVMWLISANDKTRAAVARYFNPVQLVDSTEQPQGLNDPNARSRSVLEKTKKPLPENEQKTQAAAAGATESDPQSDKVTQRDEAELFRDPYTVLAELAAKNSTSSLHQPPQAPAQGIKGGTGAVGIRNGEAYRDPFEPLAMAAETAPDAAETEAGRVRPSSRAPTQPAVPASAPVSADTTRREATEGLSAPSEAQPGVGVGALRAKILSSLKQSGGAGTVEDRPKIEVQRTQEGVLITLTDAANFSMFASASAEPAPKMVAFMEKVGRLLNGEKGHVTIRGFTDNHPFRSASYDNWRLSAARAHMAHYMLVRGGLDEARIERIEGYADRRPRTLKDPGAPENRRIEILLRDDPS